ncbi:MAG: rRNA pseudouridine synthase [Prevotella sp.]|jgi:23S rRNA pseudouridine2605 synthase|nr:rRNA pseudouridine synthase [Prevotella sp.]
MIADRDDFRYQRNDNGSRDGNSSQNRNFVRKTQPQGAEKKRRPRVGETRVASRPSPDYNTRETGYRDRGNEPRGNADYGRRGAPTYNNNRGETNYNRGERRPYNPNGARPNNGGGGRYPANNNFKKGGAPKKKIIIKPVKYKENIDPSTPLRLNKYLANAGVCSRREADNYITAGVVKVNGEVVSELGAKVTRGDYVTFHDQPVRLESKIYVLLNKPKNCVTTSDDPQNRKTVMDLVKNACPERIYPVGRLDRNTTGVLLFTNDGDMASKLMHPKFKKKKIYQVKLDRDVAIEDMQAIADGIELDDGEIYADSIAYVSEDVLNEVGIEIHSGRNRVVRRIFEKLGYQILKLDRVYFAGLTKKNLPRGKWRYLTEKEVNMLRMGAYE